MPLGARSCARLMSAGRIALGAAVLAAPEAVTRNWLGDENARHPAVADLARGLAARDIALGFAGLATIGSPRASATVMAATALADGVDALATGIAREHLPARGVYGTVAIAGAAAIAGLWLARELSRGA